jgi:hypothetical protein
MRLIIAPGVDRPGEVSIDGDNAVVWCEFFHRLKDEGSKSFNSNIGGETFIGTPLIFLIFSRPNLN